jgi:nicotinic acid mononucleotide adenylyltransferase
MADFTTRHEVDSVAPLRGQPAGHVLRLVEAMLSISSTAIRGRIATGAAVRDLLPAAVWTYINERHLYGASTA